MDSTEDLLDCYFGHVPPLFVHHPHLVIEPFSRLATAIELATSDVLQVWPVIDRIEESCGLLPTSKRDWQSPCCRKVISRLCGPDSGVFYSSFVVVTSADVSPTAMQDAFAEVDEDDPWLSYLQFVEKRRWILVPDQQGVLLIFIAAGNCGNLVESLQQHITVLNGQWMQVLLEHERLRLAGFLPQFRSVIRSGR